MPNIITVTKNNTSGSERWDIAYTVDASGTVEKTIFTAGTLFDRNEKISITTPPMSLLTTAASTPSGTLLGTIGRSTANQYINIPTGYNDTAQYYTVPAVANMTLPTAASSSSNSGTRKATINRSTAVQYINIPVGYNDTKAYYQISATPNGTVTAPNSISGTAATLSYSTTNGTLTLTKTVSVTPNVTTAGYISSGTAGNASVSLSANVDIRGSSDLSVSGNVVTVPAGYYPSGSTISATVPSSSLTNAIVNGAAVVETTNDYGFEVTVTIPEGYHNAGTITKLFSSMLPLPTGTEGTASQVLAGYSLYNHNGQLITGSMTNNGAWNQTLDQTTTSVTIPAGYHNGSGTVSHATVNIPDPTITVNTSGLVTASGSWTRGFTTDNSYSNTYQIAAAAKSTSLSGGTLGCDKQSSANITMSTTDSYTNGVSVTFRGSRAATTATTAITTAGYAAANNSFSTATLAADTADSTYYIQGVTLTAPTSGRRCFDITVPNGTNDTTTFHFEVDSNSNVVITDTHTT